MTYQAAIQSLFFEILDSVQNDHINMVVGHFGLIRYGRGNCRNNSTTNMIIFDEFIFKVNTGTPDTKSLAVKDALNHENDVAKVDRSPAERERRFFVS